MLKDRGIEGRIIPTGQPGVHSDELGDSINAALALGMTPNHSVPSVNLWHLNDMAKFAGSTRIGYTIFEMPTFDARERNSVDNLDTVWVPSEWAKEVVLNNNPDARCQVVPCGVDTDIFCPSDEPPHFKDDYFHTFVNIGKFEKRKGHELVFESMRLLGTTQTKPIRLLINCTNPFLGDFATVLKNQLNSRGFNLNESDRGEHTARFRHSENPNDCVIDIITAGGLTSDSIAEVYRSGDNGLFPYFAEGWNLPLIECMSC
ncbi:unnamed protein product, partial [marine sediment metagenome]